MKCAVYARVSTERQKDNTSPADQLRRGHQECERRGWEPVDFSDLGISGEELEGRPGLMSMLAAADAGRIGAVYVVHSNRLSRADVVRAQIAQRLRAAEVLLDVDGKLYDPTNPSDAFFLSLLGAVDTKDKAELIQKMAYGQRARGLAGGWPGGTPPYGYRLVWPGDRKAPPTVEIHPDEHATILAAVTAIVDDGLTTGEACQRLAALGHRTRGGPSGGREPGPWLHQNLRRTLSSRTLLGEVLWGNPARSNGGGHRTKVRRDGTPRFGPTVTLQLPPLLEPGRFELLQTALSLRSYGTKTADRPYPNSGATSACGGKLGGTYRRDRDLRQYRCNRAKWRADGSPRCDCPRLDASWLDAQVWEQVSALLCDPDRLLAMAAQYLAGRQRDVPDEATTLGEVEAKIAGLQRARVDRAAEYLRAGVPGDVVAAAVAEIERDLVVLTGHRQKLLAVRADHRLAQAQMTELGRLAHQAAVRCGSMGLEQQREVLALLRVQVTVLDTSTRPGLRIEGAVSPDGGGLRSLPAGAPDLPFRLSA